MSTRWFDVAVLENGRVLESLGDMRMSAKLSPKVKVVQSVLVERAVEFGKRD